MKMRRTRGFTLIEVMLAIALVALIMAMAYGGFRASVRASSSGEAIIEETNRLRVVQQFMRRQLMLAQPLVIEEDEVNGERIRFEGDRQFVRFVSPMPGYLSFGGPYVQQFRIEPGERGFELVYYYAMLNGYEPGDLYYSDGIVLIENISRATFLFLDVDEMGEDTFWDDYWEEPGRMPLAVALEMDLDRQRNEIWPDLVAPVMVDGGRGLEQRRIERASDMLIPERRDRMPRERR